MQQRVDAAAGALDRAAGGVHRVAALVKARVVFIQLRLCKVDLLRDLGILRRQVFLLGAQRLERIGLSLELLREQLFL